MTADRTTRDQLAAALVKLWEDDAGESLDDIPATLDAVLRDYLDALLPVIDRIADQRAASELRAAANAFDDRVRTWVLNNLRDRADALDPQQRNAP